MVLDSGMLGRGSHDDLGAKFCPDIQPSDFGTIVDAVALEKEGGFERTYDQSYELWIACSDKNSQ